MVNWFLLLYLQYLTCTYIDYQLTGSGFLNWDDHINVTVLFYSVIMTALVVYEVLKMGP